jgi:glutamate/tyrosine decarboxylase-like PLP-dependent enzyme/organic hydroperoxide reductase OsmC/OhrA
MSEHRVTISWVKSASADFLNRKYSREHTWTFDGGLTIPASSSPSIVPVPYSNPASVDPEEAFIAAVSSCHMLWFLSLAAARGFVLESYNDEAIGVMTKNDRGILWVSEITLQPRIAYSGARQPTSSDEQQLHHEAHEQCFIANSIKTQVTVKGAGTQTSPNLSDHTVAALRTALDHTTRHLQGLDDRSVAATVSLEDLRSRLGAALSDTGMDPCSVIDELAASSAGGHLGSAGGRFFAWVIGGSLPSALAADWLTSGWDQNAGVYACGPAAAVVEEIAGAWLKELLGLPGEASFAFTSGCQLAHFTCLASARYAVLRDVGWDVNAHGLFGAPPIRIITSDQRHLSVDRALRFLGFGNGSLRILPTGLNGELDPAALQTALATGAGPTIVVLNAGDLNIGAFDPFDRLIPMAKAAKAWVHIDGAFGLIARASRSKRTLMTGIELADSWASDAHKWLNVPYDSGLAFVRDREAHRASMTASASYITADGKARDQIDWNPEWSRRARGFAIYAALRELGRNGLEDLIDRCCAHAHSIVTGIGALPGTEILSVPQLNQGLVRFLDPRPQATQEDHNAHTDSVIAAVNASGDAFFSGTTWRAKRAMRVSVVNWRTTADDVRRTIAAVESVLGMIQKP